MFIIIIIKDLKPTGDELRGRSSIHFYTSFTVKNRLFIHAYLCTLSSLVTNKLSIIFNSKRLPTNNMLHDRLNSSCFNHNHELKSNRNSLGFMQSLVIFLKCYLVFQLKSRKIKKRSKCITLYIIFCYLSYHSYFILQKTKNATDVFFPPIIYKYLSVTNLWNIKTLTYSWKSLLTAQHFDNRFCKCYWENGNRFTVNSLDIRYFNYWESIISYY